MGGFFIWKNEITRSTVALKITRDINRRNITIIIIVYKYIAKIIWI